MSRYRCIEAFSVPRMNEYEEEIEGKSFYVRKGSNWYETDNFNVNADITLLNENETDWLGIPKETLNKYFEEVKDE